MILYFYVAGVFFFSLRQHFFYVDFATFYFFLGVDGYLCVDLSVDDFPYVDGLSSYLYVDDFPQADDFFSLWVIFLPFLAFDSFLVS